jgi:hypothetical protein
MFEIRLVRYVVLSLTGADIKKIGRALRLKAVWFVGFTLRSTRFPIFEKILGNSGCITRLLAESVPRNHSQQE